MYVRVPERQVPTPSCPHPQIAAYGKGVVTVALHSTGIVRRIDRLGRVVIPKEVRDAFGIGRDAELAFAVDGESVVLAPQTHVCTFCGSRDHVIPFHGKGICVECVQEVREIGSAG